VSGLALGVIALLLLAALRAGPGALAATGIDPASGAGDPVASPAPTLPEGEPSDAVSTGSPTSVTPAGGSTRSTPRSLSSAAPDRGSPSISTSTSSGTITRPGGRSPSDDPGDAVPPGPVDLDRSVTDGLGEWAGVLSEIDEGRRTALATGSAAQLRRWVDPDGTAWSDDVALARRVGDLHAGIDGGALVMLEVRPQREAADEVVLLVRDEREAYVVVTSDGRTEVPARAARWWRVTLAHVPGSRDGVLGRWRVRDVATVPDPGPEAGDSSPTPTRPAGAPGSEGR
jgi:hypothetical protein